MMKRRPAFCATRKRKTTTKQIEHLVNLMQEKPDIARNYTKRSTEDVAAFWEEVADKLNQLEGRQRDVAGWKKIWSDHKTYIKKKLAANKKEITGTGGGPHKQKSFTPLEDAVIALINSNDSVNGIGAKSFGTGNDNEQAASEPSSPNTTAADAENIEGDRNSNSNCRQKTLSSIQLLRKQVENQSSYYDHMKTSLQAATKALQDTTNILRDTAKTLQDSAVHLKRVYRSVEYTGEIEKKKFKEMQFHNAEMRKIAMSKLEIKAKILEIEISRTNVMLQ
ncbi:uncharacterized protein LOC129944691 [Eupeodes corollae]|uniref:uncharacterized protein LOC129944691 n=1 Tax=Eupeodes corollae TaxID=290404 RepID=UPI00248FB798|nr:uncharacterized protein LOC129944691 [Eupeodes corollae]